MKDLIKRSYESIVARGLISDKTNLYQFINKIQEEMSEFEDETYDCDTEFWKNELSNEAINEAIDIINVIINMLHHYGIDFKTEFIKCIERNEKRKIK